MAICQPGSAATGHEQCSRATCNAVSLPMQKTPVKSSHLLLHLVAECGGGHLHEAVDAGGDGCLVGQVPADAALVARLCEMWEESKSSLGRHLHCSWPAAKAVAHGSVCSWRFAANSMKLARLCATPSIVIHLHAQAQLGLDLSRFQSIQ